MGITYRDSGVDVEGGNRFVKKISPMIKSTFTDKVITDIGGFGALFSGSFPGYKDPVLVSGTDGVGTKLKVAQMVNRHDTVGIDAVAMCVNDIIVSGAKPLFFLDYISCGKLNEEIHIDVVKGIVEGCKISGCSLIGGETAEHPDVMSEDDYDIAGFAVGVADREKIINGSRISKGDVIIGLHSSGIHSNGFSMVRKIFFDLKKRDINYCYSELGENLGNVLLAPTRIYAKSITSCIDNRIDIKGIVHITGGGFYENIPRILPDNTAVEIKKGSFKVPEIFNIIQKEGEVTEREMYTTFNMGIGMMLFVEEGKVNDTVKALEETGESPKIIGRVTEFSDDRIKLI